jgi:hypothetical protein
MKKLFFIISLPVFLWACNDNKSSENMPDTAILALENPTNMLGDTLTGMIIPVNSELWKDQLETEGLDTGIVAKWDNGIFIIRKVTTTIGAYEINGSLKIKSGSGETKLPFSSNGVTFAEPSAIGVTKYLLKDIENPIEISAAGIPFSELTISCADATLMNSGGGLYKVIPHKTGPLKINVIWNHGGILKNLNALEYEVVEKK